MSAASLWMQVSEFLPFQIRDGTDYKTDDQKEGGGRMSPGGTRRVRRSMLLKICADDRRYQKTAEFYIA